MKRLLVIKASFISLFYLVLATMPVFAAGREDYMDAENMGSNTSSNSYGALLISGLLWVSAIWAFMRRERGWRFGNTGQSGEDSNVLLIAVYAVFMLAMAYLFIKSLFEIIA